MKIVFQIERENYIKVRWVWSMKIEFTIKEIGIGYKVIVLINGKRFESIQSFDTKAEAKEYVNMI